MSASGFEVNSGSLSLDSGCLGLRQGSRLCWCCQRRGYLVDKRRGQDHGQSDQQEDDRSKMRPQQARSNLGVRVPRCASLSTSLALLVHGIRPADAGSVAVTRHKVAAAPLGPISKKRAPNLRRFNDFVEWQGGDSNSQPTDYDAAHGWHDLLEKPVFKRNSPTFSHNSPTFSHTRSPPIWVLVGPSLHTFEHNLVVRAAKRTDGCAFRLSEREMKRHTNRQGCLNRNFRVSVSRGACHSVEPARD
jgi:hypothetical protein